MVVEEAKKIQKKTHTHTPYEYGKSSKILVGTYNDLTVNINYVNVKKKFD